MIAVLFLLVGVFFGAKATECYDRGDDPFWWVLGIVLMAILLVAREVL